jgi:hypothetical protein
MHRVACWTCFCPTLFQKPTCVKFYLSNLINLEVQKYQNPSPKIIK